MDTELSFEEMVKIFEEEAKKSFEAYKILSRATDEAKREYDQMIGNLNLAKWAVNLEKERAEME
jgi:hypothetical protein